MKRPKPAQSFRPPRPPGSLALWHGAGPRDRRGRSQAPEETERHSATLRHSPPSIGRFPRLHQVLQQALRCGDACQCLLELLHQELTTKLAKRSRANSRDWAGVVPLALLPALKESRQRLRIRFLPTVEVVALSSGAPLTGNRSHR